MAEGVESGANSVSKEEDVHLENCVPIFHRIEFYTWDTNLIFKDGILCQLRVAAGWTEEAGVESGHVLHEMCGNCVGRNQRITWYVARQRTPS